MPRPRFYRRFALVVVAALLFAVYGGIVFPGRASAQTTQKTVTVAATAKPPLGVDTGISVDSGDTMSFNASGNWCLGSPPVDQGYDCGGPEGWHIANAQETGALLPSVKLGTLIGTIGGSGQYFAIGSSSILTAQNSGELYLLINDRYNYYFDNGGSVTVNISVSADCSTHPTIQICSFTPAGPPPPTTSGPLPPPPPPPAPPIVSVSQASGGAIRFDWNSNTSVDAYWIDIAYVSNGERYMGTSTTVTFTGLNPGTYGCVTVIAHNSGGWSGWSAWACGTASR